jgi:hypothetical protein
LAGSKLSIVDGEADPLEGGDPTVPSGIELRQMIDRDRFRDHCDGKSTRNRWGLLKLLRDLRGETGIDRFQYRDLLARGGSISSGQVRARETQVAGGILRTRRDRASEGGHGRLDASCHEIGPSEGLEGDQ